LQRLVFANACFSSGLPTVESNRQLAGLAEAFFDRGIENYIGAGWQVSDEHAIEFARQFYFRTIETGQTLGEALSEARSAIAPQYNVVVPSDSTWGAYQHYGNPNTRLVDLEARQNRAVPRGRKRSSPKRKTAAARNKK
jgi:CHAT domain-containing protein